jgi:hypothetical protein
MGLFPTYVCQKDVEFPDEGTYFVIASNGAFIRKDFGFFEGLVPIPFDDLPDVKRVGYCVETANGALHFNKISAYKKWGEPKIESEKIALTNSDGDEIEDENQELWAVTPYIHTSLPKLPVEVAYKALAFFRRVFQKHHAEAALVLAFNEDKEQYVLYCPPQEVSGGGVTYDRRFVQTRGEKEDDDDWLKLAQAGYKPIGTIHSHCDFNAFHSTTDTSDEASFDGLHLTFGHVDRQIFSIASSLALNDWRDPIDPENVIKKVCKSGNPKAIQNRMITTDRHNFYYLDVDEKALSKLFNKEIGGWMKKVKPKAWAFGNRSGATNYGGAWGSTNYYGGGSVCAGSGFEDLDEELDLLDSTGETTYEDDDDDWVQDENGNWVNKNDILFQEKTEQQLQDEAWEEEANRDVPPDDGKGGEDNVWNIEND